MIIVLSFYKRKPGLTHAEFCREWFEVHGPLTLQVPGIRACMVRYVQHHLTPLSGFPTPDGLDFDGFSEGWFLDEAAKKRSSELIAQCKPFKDHEKQFLNIDATRWMVLDEPKVILPGPGPAL
jgi:hypothetical protein